MTVNHESTLYFIMSSKQEYSEKLPSKFTFQIMIVLTCTPVHISAYMSTLGLNYSVNTFDRSGYLSLSNEMLLLSSLKY